MLLVEVEIVVVTGNVLVCVTEVKVKLTCVDGTVLVTVCPVVKLLNVNLTICPSVLNKVTVVLVKLVTALIVLVGKVVVIIMADGLDGLPRTSGIAPMNSINMNTHCFLCLQILVISSTLLKADTQFIPPLKGCGVACSIPLSTPNQPHPQTCRHHDEPTRIKAFVLLNR